VKTCQGFVIPEQFYFFLFVVTTFTRLSQICLNTIFLICLLLCAVSHGFCCLFTPMYSLRLEINLIHVRRLSPETGKSLKPRSKIILGKSGMFSNRRLLTVTLEEFKLRRMIHY